MPALAYSCCQRKVLTGLQQIRNTSIGHVDDGEMFLITIANVDGGVLYLMGQMVEAIRLRLRGTIVDPAT